MKVYNGRTYMYYSVSTFGSKVSLIGLISASSIAAGDWRDDGLVIRTTNSNDYNAIDPDLVIDANGAPWLSFGSWNSGIKLTRLGSNMKPTGTLYLDREPWRRHRGAEHRAAQWLLLPVRLDWHLLPGREQHLPDPLRALDQHHRAVRGSAAA